MYIYFIYVYISVYACLFTMDVCLYAHASIHSVHIAYMYVYERMYIIYMCILFIFIYTYVHTYKHAMGYKHGIITNGDREKFRHHMIV